MAMSLYAFSSFLVIAASVMFSSLDVCCRKRFISSIFDTEAYTLIPPVVLARASPFESISPRFALRRAMRTVSPHSISGKMSAGDHSTFHSPPSCTATAVKLFVTSPI